MSENNLEKQVIAQHLTTETQIIEPGNFEVEAHYYPRVLNAQIHPTVAHFFNLPVECLLARYLHLNPRTDHKFLEQLLMTPPKYFAWAGSDLFNVTNDLGIRQMVVIETNSCPSGQKSMPLLSDPMEAGGYQRLIERTFGPLVKNSRRLPRGGLAVLYDKNLMEAKGYAAAMADYFSEPVYLVPYMADDQNPSAQFTDGVLMIKTSSGEWQPIRAAMRYVTQRPWTRIPVQTKTFVFNPSIACLAGGRNKMLASKAYDIYNAELEEVGLSIRTPQTIWDVGKLEVPVWVKRLGGHAVVKDPYSNAGQGVYTITNQEELDHFMALEHRYNLFIVQSLIGNCDWSSTTHSGKLYHVGTIPNSKLDIFAADLRMMVSSSPDGFRPLAVYARRAREALAPELKSGLSSWNMLGTNLSVKESDGTWATETQRLLLMDRKDFNKLGLGIDDLIDAFIQTVLAVTAIDRLAQSFINERGKMRSKLYRSMNNDQVLINEIRLE
jgi:hypothetical protein